MFLKRDGKANRGATGAVRWGGREEIEESLEGAERLGSTALCAERCSTSRPRGREKERAAQLTLSRARPQGSAGVKSALLDNRDGPSICAFRPHAEPPLRRANRGGRSASLSLSIGRRLLRLDRSCICRAVDFSELPIRPAGAGECNCGASAEIRIIPRKTEQLPPQRPPICCTRAAGVMQEGRK